MATTEQLETRLADAKKRVEQYRRARQTAANEFTLPDGKKVSTDELDKLRSDAEALVDTTNQLLQPFKAAQKNEKEIVARIARLEKQVATGKLDPRAREDSQNALTKLRQDLTDVRSSIQGFEQGAVPGTTEGVTLRADVGRLERAAETVAAAQKAKKEEKKPKDGTGAGGGTGTDGGKGGKGDKTKPVDVAAVEAKFKEMFPAQGWLWEIDAAKYPKLRAALVKAVENKAWESDTGQARFQESVAASDFYQELKTNKTVSTIRNLVGDVGFTGDTFNRFVVNASNFGWKEDTLKAETYKEAFRRDDTGNFLYQTAVDRIRKSNEYLQIANIGKAFYGQVADDTIRNVLTGGMTTEDVQRQQRELAKQKYGHLSNLIDQGLTMENIADGFRSRASQLLEKQPDSIDMSTSLFEQAFNYGEPGKKRMMTDGEWETLLRTDKRFNWDTTQNAKDEARQLASTIAQAFGRTI